MMNYQTKINTLLSFFNSSSMKKVILLAVLFILTGFTKTATTVYVCDSKGGKKYHYTQNCRGLSPCKSRIISTSKESAVASGLTLCGWED